MGAVKAFGFILEMGISVKVWHGCGEGFRFFGDGNFVGEG